jgi:hypothetical protein
MILDVLHEVGGLLWRLQHHALSPKAVPVTYACHVGLQIMSIIGPPSYPCASDLCMPRGTPCDF